MDVIAVASTARVMRALWRLRRTVKTRMWADAQRDGRPAEYRWRPLLKFGNFIPCTTPQSFTDAPLLECRNAANIRERKSWTQSEFCAWQNYVTGQESWTRNPAIAEGPRDAGVPVEIW